MTKIEEKALELRDNIIADMGLDDETMKDLGEIELRTMEYTLADAIREGSTVSKQAVGSWGDGESACALTAAVIAARSRGYIS
jgi:hypothetical protein